MKQYNKLMTTVWLILTIIGLIVAIYMMAKEGFAKGAMYLVFPVLTGMMYGFRKFMLARMERYNRDED